MDLYDIAIARKLSGGGGGGGGSSDFSIANVTVNNTTNKGIQLNSFPIIYEEGGESVLLSTPFDTLPAKGSLSLRMPLYKGFCGVPYGIITPLASYSYSVSGDIMLGDGVIAIAGDGTITIS